MNSFTRIALCLFALPFSGCATKYTTPVDRTHEPKFLVNRDSDGLALQGFDPVAYFTDGKPIEGTKTIRSKYQGAWYQFASQDHKATFDASPEKYAPAFGGWCGYAVSIDRLSPIDPHLFQILDGRLVLQHNEKAWNLWNADVKGNLSKADVNWPGLVQENAQPEKVLVNVDKMGVALEGHDPVAYFTLGKPSLGDPMNKAIYNGAIYYFVSKENRATFEMNPSKYAPAFGGFCGYAASIDKVSPVDIHLFQIINDRLVLQHTDEAYKLFNENAKTNYAKAEQNWPGLVENHGS